MTVIRQPAIPVSALIRDPALAEIFRRAERDGLAGVDADRPKPPQHDGAAARICELVEA